MPDAPRPGRGVRSPGRLRLALSATAMTGLMMSAVIWGKLRLVGSVPRTAYAEPGLFEQDPETAEPDTAAPEEGDESMAKSPAEEGHAGLATPPGPRVGPSAGDDR
ncbi:MAG: hypothetical protein AAGG07_02375 [Planctomycetota bacterium]